MIVALVAANIIFTLVLIGLFWFFTRGIDGAVGKALEPLIGGIDAVRRGLEDKFTIATADMAKRLADTKGDLRQELTDRLEAAFKLMRDSVDVQMQSGRAEQSRALDQTVLRLEGKFTDLQRATEQRFEGFGDRQTQSLAQSRRELSDSLAQNIAAQKQELTGLATQTRDGFEAFRKLVEQKLEGLADRQAQALADARREMSVSLAQNGEVLRHEFTALTKQTADRLDSIRNEVDQKLLIISDQVQQKLDQNIKEGFKQFEKVQEHLRAAEEQLRNVNTIGASINDLNNLLKLPHLRGRFGEASLERLLEDFLPAQMYEFQSAAGENGQGRADAIIKFPERAMPIDAKFPREQVLPLFESSDPAKLADARVQFARVMREQAKRIVGYIQPENGTTDMALMYLPSETLYMEAVLNGDLSEWLNKQRVFPVSPNTLIVTLQSIQMVFKMYEFAKNFEKATEELGKAQKSFGFFERKFDEIGRSLDKTQEAYGTAKRHLGTYRRRVTDLTGEQVPELEAPAELEQDESDRAK
jgi:DNA recombination protein RmuC